MSHPNRWKISTPLTPQANEALVTFPPILRQVLFNRGYASESTAQAFLNGTSIEATSPFLLGGMQVAVERIWKAIGDHEKVAIYGDYDVDGVTATALLVQTIASLGGEVRPYIPDRVSEGYGLNNEAFDRLFEDGVRLVISVDCGIRSPEEARHARELGLDLIITDHHEPFGETPAALAVINPKQEGDPYPEKYLAGVGIAYKIAQALFESPQPFGVTLKPEDLLDLVALGTVADLAPLSGENRVLVRLGLKQMRQTKWQGLFSLANVAGVSLQSVNATSIGFMLGPRLNAAGRLDSALAAYDLLTTRDVLQAGQLAQKLDMQNRDRQALTRKIQAEAETIALAAETEPLILFAVHPDFNAGVVGLAASRLVETHHLPAVVGQQGAETTRCSCRSIPEFNITSALDQCTDLLVRHGGHAAAAGFTVKNENLEPLKERLKEIAGSLRGRDLRPTLTADQVIPLSDLNADLLNDLQYLQPTGYGNPEAAFVTRAVMVKNARTVGDGKHLKLVLDDGRRTLDAIGFRLGDRLGQISGQMDLLYTFESNEYNGRSTLQLNLKDIKPSGTPD
jgi:single-stranded-DNA-specific exonuclease